MVKDDQNTENLQIKVLFLYTGKTYKNIEDIIKDSTVKDILWMEILINDRIPWEKYLHITVIRRNYKIAGGWYKNFKTLLTICGIKRRPIKSSSEKIDMRDYRKFLELLYHVS